jgi:hypothetical protein
VLQACQSSEAMMTIGKSGGSMASEHTAEPPLACDRSEAGIHPFEISSTIETAVFGSHKVFQ